MTSKISLVFLVYKYIRGEILMKIRT